MVILKKNQPFGSLFLQWTPKTSWASPLPYCWIDSGRHDHWRTRQKLDTVSCKFVPWRLYPSFSESKSAALLYSNSDLDIASQSELLLDFLRRIWRWSSRMHWVHKMHPGGRIYRISLHDEFLEQIYRIISVLFLPSVVKCWYSLLSLKILLFNISFGKFLFSRHSQSKCLKTCAFQKELLGEF